MLSFGQFDPANYVAPSSPITLHGVSNRYGYIRFVNNSPYQLAVNIDGTITQITEFWTKDIRLQPTFQGTVLVTPSIAILTASHAQAYQLTIEAYYPNEIASPVDAPIPQQAVNATASGNPIFTAFWGVGAAAGVAQTLNVYNPATSGVDMIFHAAQIFTNSAGVPQALLFYQAGADLNLVNTVTPKCHTLQPNQPVSNAHVTSADDSGHYGAATSIENYRSPGRTTQATVDLLAFPDTITLKPGGNLMIVSLDTVTGDVVALVLKWTEQVAIPVPNNGSVPILTAANIVNDGNAPGTGLIESTPNDGSGQAVYATNDGQLTWKVDQAGVLHQVLHTQTSGNPLQVGQAGDSVEFLGSPLLENNQPIKAKDTGGVARYVLYVDTGNNTTLVAGTNDGIVLKDHNFTNLAIFTTTTGMQLLSGGSLKAIAFGSVAVSNAAGGTTVTHGLGTTPAGVQATQQGTISSGGTAVTVQVSNITSTQFTLHTNINITVYWFAYA